MKLRKFAALAIIFMSVVLITTLVAPARTSTIGPKAEKEKTEIRKMAIGTLTSLVDL